MRFIGVGVVAVLVFGGVSCDTGDPAGEGTTIVEDDPGEPLGSSPEELGGPADGELGSRSNPVSIGQRVQIGPDWQVELASVNRDAWDAIRAENQFNDPPATGRQFVIGRFGVTYSGDESGTPWVDLSFRFNGSRGNTFSSGSDDYCGVIPDALSDAGEMFPGASVEGNECVSVPSEQVEGGMFLVEQSFSFRPTRVFFSLN